MLCHLWEQMEIWQCQMRTVWWMWKNFSAPGVEEIQSCSSSLKLSIFMQKKNCGRQSWSLFLNSLFEYLEFPDKQLSGRCEINQQNSRNILENRGHHFPRRVHCLELLFDWRVRMLPGHLFSLALWDVVEDQSVNSYNNSVWECFTMLFVTLKKPIKNFSFCPLFQNSCHLETTAVSVHIM